MTESASKSPVSASSSKHSPLQTIEYPYRRRWLALPNSDAASSSPSASFELTLVSYNMLAQALVRRDLFTYCTKNALKIALRRENLLKELSHLRPDILCAQEVDRDLYTSFWQPKLAQLGYKSEWGSRIGGKHGCAIFYLTSKFEVFSSEVVQFSDVLASQYADDPDNQHQDPTKNKASVYEEMNRPNIAQIVGLKVKESSASTEDPLGLYVTNTHLFWDPRYRFVRLKQCQTLLDQLARTQEQYKTAYPSVLAGDWNITPDNIIHEYLTGRNTLEKKEDMWTKFLTPAEHGLVRGEEGAPPVDPAELASNSGVSNASMEKMLAALKLEEGEAKASKASSSSAPAASSSKTEPETSPNPEWQPVSNAPIHQLRSQMITQSDGSVKEYSLEGEVDHTSEAAKRRLEEVQRVFHHSRDLPLLQSVYSEYDAVVPADVKASLQRSRSAPYCRWVNEPPFTNYTEKFKGTLDYIFLIQENPAETKNTEPHPWRAILANQTCTLSATHLLEIPSEETVSKFVALPNDQYSSDHVSIAARLVLKRKTQVVTAGASSSSSGSPLQDTAALAKSIAASLAPPISPLHAAGGAVAAASSSSAAPAPFSVSTFKSLLRTAHCGRNFLYTPSCGSTMDLCKEALFGEAGKHAQPKSGTVWLADEQTKGRGRVEGRSWNSPSCANIYFTLLIQLTDLSWEQQYAELIKMNQSVCLSVARAIEKTMLLTTGLSSLPPALAPKIKWPNDIWINGRKVSGMLIDSEIMGKEMSVIIGVGINVFESFYSHPDPSLRASATSVTQSLADWRSSQSKSDTNSSASPAAAASISREQILADFLHSFEGCASRTREQVLSEYRQYDMLLGNTIVVMPKKREDTTSYFEAKAIDYSLTGHLLIEKPDGSREELVAEEVGIRPAKQQ